ncbi:cytochrome aa3 quinol oxidase subunit IV [Bacillus salipaludis]|uniref:Quinol oxidase subunit 4 n=1 Tax=Bacillus salipaludis TaxID=2547811 RepID=A0A4V6PMG6_9BACI|nr:cytochrome aa3 quinol oxidase subunit IV [Bacillus salipaludis]MDQ6597377.1 cytochrome aa3 quinol oxidase subunit IV [Bacillus salipaludis]MED1470865.1 cytochrome aa3 quinol oxidase subunit IV [Bacillus salipaludis]TDK63193.1 cytochrome aa3 quinol oxidase subunit IV [Bacillus salipaludis]
MEKHSHGTPLTQVLGFVFSLVLTFVALFVALKTGLSFNAIMWIIGTLAVIQAGLQLFMFMHLRDGEDSAAQTINVIYGVFIAVVTVAGSIWVMSFGGM